MLDKFLFNHLKFKKESLKFWDFILLYPPLFIIGILFCYLNFKLYPEETRVAILTLIISYCALLIMTHFIRLKNIYISLLHFILIVGIFLFYFVNYDKPLFNDSTLRNNVLLFPLISFISMHFSRSVYVLLTKNEPIMRYKGDRNGYWNHEEQRELNKYDAIYSLTPFILIFTMIFMLIRSTIAH